MFSRSAVDHSCVYSTVEIEKLPNYMYDIIEVDVDNNANAVVDTASRNINERSNIGQ